MVAFASLIVLATAGLTAVSGLAVRKRDAAGDISSIGDALNSLDTIINSLNVTDPATTSLVVESISALTTSVYNAGAHQATGGPLSDADLDSFASLFTNFTTLISDIDNQVPIIQQVPQLASTMAVLAESTEGAVIQLVTSTVPNIPAAEQNAAIQVLSSILQAFDDVEAHLLGISSLNATSS